MSVDWAWRWCSACGVVFKDAPIHPPWFCPFSSRPNHTPAGPAYGIDVDDGSHFARCQSCSHLVDVTVPGRCIASHGPHFTFAATRLHIPQGKARVSDGRAMVFSWGICSACGCLYKLGEASADVCAATPSMTGPHTHRADEPPYTLLAGMAPAPVLPDHDPGHVWGYFSLVDTALPIPTTYHLEVTGGVPYIGHQITVEFVAVAGGHTVGVQLGAPHTAIFVPPASPPEHRNVVLWSARLLGDASYHGLPAVPGEDVPLPPPEALDTYSVGTIRYNPAEWRYLRVSTARAYAGADRREVGGGVLDTYMPGLPPEPPLH